MNQRPRVGLAWDRTYAVLLVLLLLFLAAVLMFPSNPLDRLPGQDNGVFLYGGQQLLDGRVPYQDFWDHKGPLIFLLNAAGLAFTAGSRWGVWLLELVFLVLTALGIYRAATLSWGRLAGLVAVLTWAAAMRAVGSYHHFRDSNYTETYALLFNAWSIYLWLMSRMLKSPRRWLIGVGLLGGLSFALRPNNIGIQASIVLLELIFGGRPGPIRYRLSRTGFIAAGAAFVVGGILLWFGILGALPDLVDQTVTYNLAYSAKNLSRATAMAVFAFGNRALGWSPLVLYAVLASLAVASGGRPRDDRGVSSALIGLLLLGWPLEALLTVASGRALLHYYILWTPHLALSVAALVGPIPGTRLGWLGSRRSLLVALAVALAVLAAANTEALAGYARVARQAWRNPTALERSSAIAVYLAREMEADETLLVWGNDAWINFLARRPAPDRYVYQYPLFLPGYTSQQKVGSFLADLQARPPQFIVEPIVDTDEIVPLSASRRAAVQSRADLPEGIQALFQFVCRYYQQEDEIGGVLIYGLREHPRPTEECP